MRGEDRKDLCTGFPIVPSVLLNTVQSFSPCSRSFHCLSLYIPVWTKCIFRILKTSAPWAVVEGNDVTFGCINFRIGVNYLMESLLSCRPKRPTLLSWNTTLDLVNVDEVVSAIWLWEAVVTKYLPSLAETCVQIRSRDVVFHSISMALLFLFPA